MPPKRKVAEIDDSSNANGSGGVLHFLTCKEGTSDKFYEISLTGNKVITRYGRSGTQGAAVVKELPSAEECTEYIESLVAEKKKKGYKAQKVAANSAVPASPVPKKQAISKEDATVPSKNAEVNYLECVEGGSSKFYELILDGDQVFIRYGKIGADGVRSEKSFDGDEDAAAKFAEKTVAEKEKKGYEHVEPPGTASSTQAPGAKKAAPAKAAPVKAEKQAPTAVAAPQSTKRSAATEREVNYMECFEGGSSKFYELILDGDQVFIRYGKIGADGVRSEKSFNGDTAAAAKFAEKTVAEKEKKGYEHADPPGGEAPEAPAAKQAAPAKATGTKAAPAKSTEAEAEEEVTPASQGYYLEWRTPRGDNTFYKVTLEGEKATLRHGKIGTAGFVILEKYFNGDLEMAAKFVRDTVSEKQMMGYEVVTRPVDAEPEYDDGCRVVTYMEGHVGGKHLFYEVVIDDDVVHTRYGQVGFQGVQSATDFNGDMDSAVDFVDNLIAEQKQKGYTVVPRPSAEVVVNAAPAPAPTSSDRATASVPASAAAFSSAAKRSAATGREVNYLECFEGGSSKFYELILDGDQVFIRYGKIGADGVRSEKSFNGDTAAAAKFAEKTVAEKEKKGYEHADPPGEAPAAPPAKKAAPAKATGTKAVDSQPAAPAATSGARSSSSSSSSAGTAAAATTTSAAKDVHYLECKDGTSHKFYEVTLQGDKVTLRYGRIGTDGVRSDKSFDGDAAAAAKFALKTVGEKEKKGYCVATNLTGSGDAEEDSAVAAVPSSGNLSDDLENGQKVFIKGSSALPYTLKKFNGRYSCSCPGWAIQVHIKGVQATSCKHLKLVRGEETEAERCQASAGTKTSSAARNNSITSKISLAQQWTANTDPTGYIMSEKLDGMRAYWCGKKLWTRSGLPIFAPEWFLTALPTDLPLDGELFLGRQMFDECMSIARRTDASEDWKKLKYVVFDAPTIKGGIMARLEKAQTAFDAAGAKGSVYWTIHPQSVCRDMEHLLDELAVIEAQGGEGLMLRSASAAHRGGRSSDLLKVKSFHDDEALVTAHEDGKGKYQGQVGSLVCISKTGARFKVGSGLTDAMRTNRGAPPPGTVITFKYFELTKDGVPRFPTFLRVRPDVDKSAFPSA